jgi:hypothetical protein
MSPRALRLTAAAIAVVALLAGCANIPDQSMPRAVPQIGDPAAPQLVQPKSGLDPLNLVRDFITASASPEADHAAARVYLANADQQKWTPGAEVKIILDTFATVPEPAAGDDSDGRTVTVRALEIGHLGLDSTFTPASPQTAVNLQINVRRQPDGQWRIINPPKDVVVPVTEFTKQYRQVRVFFFDPGLRVLVPDLRYVPAQASGKLPSRVIGLLLSGPSDRMKGAVVSALGPNVATRAPVDEIQDGTLLVNLGQLGEQDSDRRKLIAHQVVRTLQGVTNAPVRLEADSVPLVPGHGNWQFGDVPSYDAAASPNADLAGLVVANGRIRSLKDGALVDGLPGSGEGQVISAAQTLDGSQVAVVSGTTGGARLRVGKLGQQGRDVALTAVDLTRPTWAARTTGPDSGPEVWTVADGATVVRAVNTPGGEWVPKNVNADELARFGQITALRLSRDGVRVAVVSGGSLIIAAVVRDGENVALRTPQVIQGSVLNSVVGVDWQDQDTVVAASASGATLVVRVQVDGLEWNRYNSSNLTGPMTALTAAPSRPVIGVDTGGMWTSSDIGEVWRPHAHTQGAKSVPFYPG